MNLAFAGTPEFAATILSALLDAGLHPSLVLTQPDRPSGRGRKLVPSPVKQVAASHSLEILQTPTLRPKRKSGQAAIAQIEAKKLDVLIVAAYGLILPQEVLDLPRYGAINVHASLLPRWRGAAPVERAIMAGDRETGVTIMQMDAGLDTGDMLMREACTIGDSTTGDQLTAQLATLGAQSLLSTLGQLPNVTPVPQNDNEATYAEKLTAPDAQIDWTNEAETIHNQVRALTGRMDAWTSIKATPREDDVGIRMKVIAARTATCDNSGPPGVVEAGKKHIHIHCGSGALDIQQLQLNVGKGRIMSAEDALRGYSRLFTAETRFA